MFKNLRTSTKLVLLCSAFIVSIVVATYGLVSEKQITIKFVSKELVGTRYLEALRDVYAAILTEDLDASGGVQTHSSVDKLSQALAAAEAETAGVLNTAELEQALMAALEGLLSSKANGSQKDALVVGALAKARNLASRIGDDSNLALDPDLDSYYLQDIVLTKMPTLIGQIGEFQSQLRSSLPTDLPSNKLTVRTLILEGMIRSTLEEIGRDVAAAYRGGAGRRLRQAIDAPMTSMMASADSYLKTASGSVDEASASASLSKSYVTAADEALRAWTLSQSELTRLLNQRRSNLVGKLRGSLILNGLLASLSIALAVMTHRFIVGPLRKLEGLAEKVRETKNYNLRADYDSRDEIGRLAGAFNAMLAELAAARGREAADQKRTATMQAELTRVSRLTTMGEIAASIAHEINQPLTAVVTNANAGLRWLDRQPPNLEEARAALKRIVHAGGHGSNVIGSIRAMLTKGPHEKTALDINDLILEVMTLVQSELKIHSVLIRTELVDDLPHVMADRIQLQQVILNLIMNAVEAMASVSDRPRVLSVRSEKDEPASVLVTIADSGTGIDLVDMHRIFEAFFTKKAEGMGIGLSICRSIVEAHGGRISASRADPHGSAFQVTLPTEVLSDPS
jgi:signal transduction histidine kinase